MSKKMKSNILLFLTAFIWGSAFVAQKSGMDYIEPFTYNGIRTFIGGLVLIQNGDHRGRVLRNRPVCSLQSAAVRRKLYHSRKGRIHHDTVCGICTDYQSDSEKKSQTDHVAVRGPGCGGIVPTLHDGFFFQPAVR